jgi:hypothetical protein
MITALALFGGIAIGVGACAALAWWAMREPF